MEHQDSDRTWRRIDDPNAARLLIDVQQLSYLQPFMAQASSIGQAAEQLDVSNDDMYYRVKRMERLGILEVVREEARAGKAIKYYSVVAGGLFVPFAATPADTLETLLLGTDSAFETNLAKGIVGSFWEIIEDPETWGLRLFKDDRGRLHLDYGPEDAPDDWDLQAFLSEPHYPAIISAWTEFALSHEDAKALQRKLQALHEEYRAKSTHKDPPASSRRYLLRVALAPLSARRT